MNVGLAKSLTTLPLNATVAAWMPVLVSDTMMAESIEKTIRMVGKGGSILRCVDGEYACDE